MRCRTIHHLVAVAWLTACVEHVEEPDTHSAEQSAQPATPAASSNVEADAPCQNAQTAAQQLLAASQVCSRDEECSVTGVAAPCLSPFLCPVALSHTASLEALERQAGQLSKTYRACTQACATASCAYGTDAPARCNPDTQRCEIDASRMALRDAGAATNDSADAGLRASDADVQHDDAGPTDAHQTSDPRYACTQGSDCMVKNVGNCCGYYPRCANVAAEFTPPRCQGVASVCGFPDITSCECRDNTCVSLQDGHRI